MSTRTKYRRRGGRNYYGSKVNYALATQEHADVYTNPFSLATTQPKIPDGKSRLSVGVKMQNVLDLTNDATGTMDLVLIPSVDSAVTVGKVNNVTSTNTIANQFNNHLIWTTGNEVGERSNIERFRIVSAAMKVTLLNNSDENDGWWEAIRIPVKKQDFQAIQVQSGADTDNVFVELKNQQKWFGINKVEHPSYVTGKLRTLDKFMFQLMPTDTSHDFITVDRQNTVNLVDDSYDAIVLRLHGRPGISDGETSGTPTRIMVHSVSNQEIIYQEEDTNTKFHTPSKVDMQFKYEQAALLKGGVAAAHKARTEHKVPSPGQFQLGVPGH